MKKRGVLFCVINHVRNILFKASTIYKLSNCASFRWFRHVLLSTSLLLLLSSFYYHSFCCCLTGLLMLLAMSYGRRFWKDQSPDTCGDSMTVLPVLTPMTLSPLSLSGCFFKGGHGMHWTSCVGWWMQGNDRVISLPSIGNSFHR